MAFNYLDVRKFKDDKDPIALLSSWKYTISGCDPPLSLLVDPGQLALLQLIEDAVDVGEMRDDKTYPLFVGGTKSRIILSIDDE